MPVVYLTTSVPPADASGAAAKTVTKNKQTARADEPISLSPGRVASSRERLGGVFSYLVERVSVKKVGTRWPVRTGNGTAGSTFGQPHLRQRYCRGASGHLACPTLLGRPSDNPRSTDESFAAEFAASAKKGRPSGWIIQADRRIAHSNAVSPNGRQHCFRQLLDRSATTPPSVEDQEAALHSAR